ncbi:hypothetical protein LTR08_006194 [Meristemomyces frigidus]|nr:hypothetical protein LTR08_006194 [Meristemomyces frigidus]
MPTRNDALARVYDEYLCRIHVDNPATPLLPVELRAVILFHLGLGPTGTEQPTPTSTTLLAQHPALTPPGNGAHPFIKLPFELRFDILSTFTLPSGAEVHPRCTSDVNGWAAPSPADKPPRQNGTSDLMVLNKKICDEITSVVYENRVFVLHVHEGIKNGGIEFLDVGRQPLQYKNDISDRRFEKFKRGEKFGFERLKKLRVDIYPSNETNRLVSINTYYMNLSLVTLLERGDGVDKKNAKKPNRITNLKITFQSSTDTAQERHGRRAIMNAESYWWDADNDCPRATSIHGIANIELVLIPFSRLRCHNASIQLPNSLQRHPATRDFVDRLLKTMLSDEVLTDLMDDNFQLQLESGRAAYNSHIMSTLFGNADRFHVPDLTEADLEQDKEKRGRSLSPHSRRFSGDKKRRRSDESLTYEEQLQIALLESAEQDEDWQMQQVMIESAKVLQNEERGRTMFVASWVGEGRVLGGAAARPRRGSESAVLAGGSRRAVGRRAGRSRDSYLNDTADGADGQGLGRRGDESGS